MPILKFLVTINTDHKAIRGLITTAKLIRDYLSEGDPKIAEAIRVEKVSEHAAERHEAGRDTERHMTHNAGL